MFYHGNIHLCTLFSISFWNYLYDISMAASATIFHKVVVVDRIIGEASCKHVISAMQGDSTTTYV